MLRRTGDSNGLRSKIQRRWTDRQHRRPARGSHSAQQHHLLGSGDASGIVGKGQRRVVSPRCNWLEGKCQHAGLPGIQHRRRADGALSWQELRLVRARKQIGKRKRLVSGVGQRHIQRAAGRVDLLISKINRTGRDLGQRARPAPSSSKVCDPAGPLSVKVRKACSGPICDATNPTSNVHSLPGRTGAVVQADDPISEKSARFWPVMVTADIPSGASPVLVSATPAGGTMVDPTGCVPKFTWPTLKATLAAVALVGTPCTRNPLFSGGFCWQLAQVSCIPLFGLLATGKFPALVAPVT